MAKTIKVDKNGFVVLSDFTDFLDISKVKFYKMTVTKDKTIVVKFYDSKKKLVRPYEQQ